MTIKKRTGKTNSYANARHISQAEIVEQFSGAMRAAGLESKATIKPDGELHRFKVEGDNGGSRNGWYVLHLDGVPAGEFGCWKRNIAETWRADIGRELTGDEAKAEQQRLDAARRAREAERGKVAKQCREKSRKLWNQASETVVAGHAYLKAKRVRSYGLRQLGDMLLVPVGNGHSELHGLQFIKPDGSKTFKTGTAKRGAFHMIGDVSADCLAIAEGYATAATIHALIGWPVAVAFDAGNLAPVADALHAAYPQAALIVCGDNDHGTAGNPGKTKATAAARTVAGRLALPEFGKGEAGTDWNDYASTHGRKATVKALRAAVAIGEGAKPAKPQPASNKAGDIRGDVSAQPVPHFEIRDAGRRPGVYWCGVSFNNGQPVAEPPLFVCSPLRILAASRDTLGGEWGRLLEFKDRDRVRKLWAMPMRMLGGSRGDEIRGELFAAGLPEISSQPKARTKLHDYLMQFEGRERVRCVNRTGWHGKVFVMPGESFGESPEDRFFFQSENIGASVYESTGTLAEWIETVARPCGEHRRLILALSAAFAGPLITLAGGESGGFHLVGGSSSGKTTALRLSSTIWGNPATYWRQWRATDNGLEAVAGDFSDSLMALDEIGQADAKDIGAMAYMIANGRGKQRAGRTGGAREVKSWRVMLLSTGEVGTSTLLNTAGQKKRGGHDVRLVEVNADTGNGFGLFDSAGGYSGARELSGALLEAAACSYGHAGPEFVRRVAAERDEVAQWVRKRIDEFIKEYTPANADGQVYRVAARFGLLAAAGELATKYDLTGWHLGSVAPALADGLEAWLHWRGTTGAQEPAAMVAQVRHFLELHGGARFQNLVPEFSNRDMDGDQHETRVIQRAGFRKMIELRPVYMILPEVFKTEVCAGYQPSEVAKALDAAGCLVRQGAEDRYTMRVRNEALGGKPGNYYVIDRDKILGAEPDAA